MKDFAEGGKELFTHLYRIAKAETNENLHMNYDILPTCLNLSWLL